MGLLWALTVSPGQAVCCCLAMTATFVGSLYMLPASIRSRPRDDPVHIRGRFLSVIAACCLCLGLCLLFVRRTEDGQLPHARPLAQWLGLWDWGLWGSLWLPLGNVMCLFAGPIVAGLLEAYVDWRYEARYGGPVHPRAKPLPLWSQVVRPRLMDGQSPESLLRNLVFGPVSEELVFRSMMLPLLWRAGWSRAMLIWASPALFFGLAHLHHALQRIREGMPVVQSLVVAVVQLCYTSMFGWYANTLFLRSALLWPCVLAHAFCNFMGLPDLSFLAAPAPPVRAGAFVLHQCRWLLLAVYVAGIYLFALTLLPSTDGALRSQGDHKVYWSMLRPPTAN